MRVEHQSHGRHSCRILFKPCRSFKLIPSCSLARQAAGLMHAQGQEQRNSRCRSTSNLSAPPDTAYRLPVTRASIPPPKMRGSVDAIWLFANAPGTCLYMTLPWEMLLLVPNLYTMVLRQILGCCWHDHQSPPPKTHPLQTQWQQSKQSVHHASFLNLDHCKFRRTGFNW